MHTLMNSVYGLKDDEYDDKEGEVDETVQKDHKTLNRLKRDVGEFKEKTQNNIINLRSTLIINDILKGEASALRALSYLGVPI